MFKLLAFLLILCVLFGVETTRELFFGTVGFIIWAIVFLVGAGLLVTIFKDYEPDHEEEERKKREDEARKAFYDAKRKASIKRQKDWAAKHPKKAKLLDAIMDHPMVASLIVASIIVAIVVAVAIVISI